MVIETRKSATSEEIVEKSRYFEKNQIIEWMKQLTSAVRYLHLEKQLAHLNINIK